MTGATVIIRKGDSCIMGKVRFDGFDVKEFFVGGMPFQTPHDQLWQKYIAWRRQDFSDLSLSCEMETKYDDGFRFEFPPDASMSPAEWYRAAEEKALELIDKEMGDDDFDGLQVCYADCELLVDYDSQGIIEIGEEEASP